MEEISFNKNLFQMIINRSDNLRNQIKLNTLNSFVFNNNIITYFSHYNMTDNRLQQINCHNDEYLWSGLIQLYAGNNERIKNVDHLSSSLRFLIAIGGCGIDQEGISELSLIKLNITNNHKIKNVNHMAHTLKYLDASDEHNKVNQ